MEEIDVPGRKREETNDDGDGDDVGNDDDGNKSASDILVDGEKSDRKNENSIVSSRLNHNFVSGDAGNDNNDEKVPSSCCFGRKCYFAHLMSYFRTSLSTCRQR